MKQKKICSARKDKVFCVLRLENARVIFVLPFCNILLMLSKKNLVCTSIRKRKTKLVARLVQQCTSLNFYDDGMKIDEQ